MEKGLTSIVILNYNGELFLKNCLESVIINTKREFEIIVVDNNSPDNSAKMIKDDFPDCKFILNQENVGVPEGLNIGIRNSVGEFIILMNNDVKVTEGWLDDFFYAYEKYGIALYQPKFVKMNDPDILDGTGDMINLFGFGFARDKGKKDSKKHNSIEEISYASGTCMFLPRKIVEEIGYFDHRLFAYHEELDFGWRARLAGYSSFYVPKSVIQHYGSAGWGWSGKKFYFLERNRWIVMLKNYSFETLVMLVPSLILLEIIMLGFFAKKGILTKKIWGYGSIIRSLNQIRKDRKKIQKSRKIGDEKILEKFCSNMYIPPESEESHHMKRFNNLLVSLAKISGYYNKVKLVE
tara:strand:- start:59 stop:1111 length:1053 start_codon:yes stop_codon:yes gene_type:complete